MLEGHLLNERYRIKANIGGGGMANVYLGYDTILDREVAIKILRLEYANDEEFIARFHREAEAATSLAHPNIVNIYDVGEENHILYMVMEYVDGMTLKEYIQKQGPVGVEEALEIMQQITAAIAHAHANHLVHRDIKPQNILLDRNGQVKVTDFGIAVALSATSLTQTNSILGSVHYLSPEQARGGLATKKSDIYSLGIVLYELLTGRLPFMGHSPVSIALKHLQTETPSVRKWNEHIPQSVENIVLKATAKDPFHRFTDMDEMEVSLSTALDPERINEPRYTPPVEAGEDTKAIPIITDQQLQSNPTDEETIIHQSNESTKTFVPEINEQKPKKKKAKKRKWFWIGSISVFLIATLIAVFLLPKWLKPNEIEIPDLVEWEYDEAVAKLEELGLEAERELIPSAEIEEDYVIKTDPRAGRNVIENSTVTLFVSEGKEKVSFDDYIGRDFEQVKNSLEDQEFKEVIAYEKHSDQPEGEIISQIQPEPDDEVVPSETRVIFEVSIGPELINLIDLKGLKEEEVEEYLNENNLKMNKKEEHSEDVPEGLVIRQDPEPNKELEENSTVDVYFSTGPEEEPPVLHSETFTVPYILDQDSNNNDDLEEQSVQIYIGDMNNDLSDVYQEDYITADKEYMITLTIAEGETAEYRVVSNGEEIIQEKVPYEEGG